MTEALATKYRNDAIPLPVAGAAVTAFAMLYVTAEQVRQPRDGQLLGLPILGALLLLTYATRWRLPSSRWYGYALRALLFGAILLIVGLPREDTSFWYFKQEYTSLAGYLLAAEMVVQAWRWRDWSDPPEAIGVAILLTALIVAAASNTYKHRQIGYFVPVYVALLLLSLRRIGSTAQPPRRTAALMVFRMLVALATLAIGYAAVGSVNRYDIRIIRFAMKLLNRPDLHAEIGLSDTPYLGAVFNPRASLERVLVIEGPLSDPHLRAMAFDRYEAHVWRPMLRERTFVPIDSDQLSDRASGPRAVVNVLTELSGLVVAPLESAGIVCDAPLDRDEQAVLQTRNLTPDLTYQIIGSPHAMHQGPLCIPPADDQRSELLKIPDEIDPRVSRFAREVAGSGSATARLSRIEAELREHHAYSLSFIPNGEPIGDFVLNHRAAHCEYFASAMVIMARAVGIPARFVSGYYAHEQEDGQTVVRGRDAHAWAECWVDAVGWITVDATPSTGTPDELYPPPSAWRRGWDFLCDLPRLIRRVLSKIDRIIVVEFAGAASVIALLTSLYRYWRRRRKRAAAQWRSYTGLTPDLAAAARRFERAASHQGLLLLPHRTWRESLDAAPVPFRNFVAEYDILRFGGAGDMRRLNQLLDQIEKEPRNAK